jgi:dipeptidyl aminopeptidase/acylaminoacyl peptidase
LTTGQFNDTSPRWSPDGKELAFISNRDGKQQVYRYWMGSGQMARVTSVQNTLNNISWSPDGKWISFVSLVLREPRTVPDMPKAPKDAKWADPVTMIDSLIYRFDKNGYLKPGNYHVFVVPIEGGPRGKSRAAILTMAFRILVPGLSWSGRPTARTF